MLIKRLPKWALAVATVSVLVVITGIPTSVVTIRNQKMEIFPTPAPSVSAAPSDIPSQYPTYSPSSLPSLFPSDRPSLRPSSRPSSIPSLAPSVAPSVSDQPSMVPTLTPSFSPSGKPSFSPSMYPTVEPGPPLEIFGDDAVVNVSLSRCQGDCDSDDDCMGDLVCFEGSSGRDWAPGCTGTMESGQDVCIRPIDVPEGPVGPTQNSFRLRMYWEKGYNWQEIKEEQFFCMDCDSGCRPGHNISVQKCGSSSTWFEFLNMESDGAAQLMVAESNMCLELVGSVSIKIQECAEAALNYTRQKFAALNGNFLWGNKFEIETVHRPGSCLSQQHHPRSGELIKRIECPTTRDDFTSFWTKY